MFSTKYGSKLQVFKGVAEMTTGRLKKADLMKNRYGKIVSRRRSEASKKNNNLKDFINPKGVFKLHERKTQ